MIIVSQDKRSITNFKQVAIININRSDLREIEAYFDCNENNRNSILLGKYVSEERAKEVLQEITIAYKEGKFLCKVADNEWQRCNTLYEMPER